MSAEQINDDKSANYPVRPKYRVRECAKHLLPDFGFRGLAEQNWEKQEVESGGAETTDVFWENPTKIRAQNWLTKDAQSHAGERKPVRPAKKIRKPPSANGMSPA
jgi:hypothetical protein